MVWLVGVLALLVFGGGALAQSGGDFTIPQIVLDTGGHQGPPRAIVFTRDGRQMLTGGMDKVIRVWNLEGGRLELARTIRPAIWRGPAGTIYAMALSPKPIPGEPGQYYLAVAGYGVESHLGNIGLFRFPGALERPNGDIVGQLPPTTSGRAIPQCHTNTVMALAFAPDGMSLASAGLDGKVLIWDLATRTVVREMVPSKAGVNALAYSSDGKFLVSGSEDGLVCVWDPARGGEPLHRAEAPRETENDDPRGKSVRGLAVSPGAFEWIFVGRENVTIRRYKSDLSGDPILLERSGNPGSCETMAVSPDGKRLVTSVVAQRLERLSDLPSVACRIELRSLPDGGIVGPNDPSDNLVYAVAFSPDSRYLVHGGGDRQALVVRDLERPDRPTVTLAGQGQSVWDVGWTKDSRAVGYARTRAGAGTEYEGFDLFERKLVEVDGGGLAREVGSSNGYRARAIDPLNLAITTRAGREVKVALDPVSERRWWEWSFIPPGPGHSKTVLAVGCEAGILMIDPESGRRLRHLAGHAGPIYALAPSPDGRWLATGSQDQTIRFWPLAGCDKPATLGLRIQRGADGRWRVQTVDRLGFADRDRMELKPGDVIEQAVVAKTAYRPERFADWLVAADAAAPNTVIQLIIRRGNEQLGMMTTKRDSPVLSLFVGLDREWVVWMPQGYYETSVAGDRKYLIWHRNGAAADQPTETFPADRFERELRLPNVLNTLLATADLGLALAAVPVAARNPEALVAAGAPPVVEVVGPPGRLPDQVFAVNAPALAITPTVTAPGGRSPVATVSVQVDGKTLVVRAPTRAGPVSLRVPPGLHRVSVVAVNAQGRESVEGFDAEVTAPAAKVPRLAVLSVGVSGPFEKGKYPAIAFADRDATGVAERLTELGGKVFETVLDYEPITKGEATSRVVSEALTRLAKERLGPEDTLMVMLESHYVGQDANGYFVGNDAGPGFPPAEGISAKALAELLENVAAGGSRVVVLVDAVHPETPAEWGRGFREWVRGLSRRGVVAFVASNSGPGQRYAVASRGAFAEGVIQAPTARGQFRPWVDPASAFTLDDFKETVIRRVEELTRRKQHAAGYFPETVSPSSRLFDAGKTVGGRP